MNVIQRLGELMGKGTPGTWHSLPCPEWKNSPHSIRNDDKEWACFGEIARAHENNAALICAMHAALPQLLAVVRAAEEVQYQAAKAGPFNGEQSLEDAFVALDAALAPLI